MHAARSLRRPVFRILAGPLCAVLVLGALTAGATGHARSIAGTRGSGVLDFSIPSGIDPARNIAASPGYPSACASPSSSTCVSDGLAALNHARSAMGKPAYSLPSNFRSLSGAGQLLALTNSDRALYHLAPVSGLNTVLDAAAALGIGIDGDPSPVRAIAGVLSIAWTSNWAEGWASPLYTYYEWMYDDGPGGTNSDCGSGGGGCWSHRNNTLANFGSGYLVVGIASGTSPRYRGPAFTELFQLFLRSVSGTSNPPTRPPLVGVAKPSAARSAQGRDPVTAARQAASAAAAAKAAAEFAQRQRIQQAVTSAASLVSRIRQLALAWLSALGITQLAPQGGGTVLGTGRLSPTSRAGVAW